MNALLNADEGEYQMKHNVMLTIASLLSILFFMFHLTDDIVRGFEKGGFSNLTAVPIFVVWLYGTLVLAGRREEAKSVARRIVEQDPRGPHASRAREVLEKE